MAKKKKTVHRVCPLLEKFFITDQTKDWEIKVCLNCIVSPICVLELSGRVPPILNEKLRNTAIPCPQCQDDPIYWKEVMGGSRISGLYKPPDEDGDWACRYCGFRIYKNKPLKRTTERLR